MNIKPIRNDDDLRAALKQLERVFQAKAGTSDADEMEILMTLIEAYERKHYPIAAASPVEPFISCVPSDELKNLVIKYRCDDIDLTPIHERLMFIALKQLEYDMRLAVITLNFLSNLGLQVLIRYARKEIPFGEFLTLSEPEKIDRIRTAKERAARLEQEEAERANRAQYQSLFEKYGLFGYTLHGTPEKTDWSKLLNILNKVDSGVRLAEEEYIWLLANKKAYFTKQLEEAHHKNEAEFYASEFKQRKDPWLAVNASGHYRKCREAEIAEQILSTIALPKIKNAKLKSALCTTHGGVKRDLRKWDEALNLGEQAHLLTPQNFQPCTLLGAINIEIGNYDLGRAWYDKAVARGYTEKAVDDDLRRIFKRLEKSKQDKLRDYLLSVDPIRYSWASKKSS